MAKVKVPHWTIAEYERAADRYCRSLPLEHFMEAVPQSTQRKITLESLDIMQSRRADVQVFNELLIQYFFKGKLRRVVPDNMLRLCTDAPLSDKSYNLEYEPGPPFLVFEYVSPSNPRKDYKESFTKYEKELRVPYCLMFFPERQALRVHRLTETGYEPIVPNAQGRFAIPELELEVAIQNEWVRFWHRGELLPLPAELQQQLDQAQHRADLAEAEVARLKALLEQTQTGESKPSRRRKTK